MFKQIRNQNLEYKSEIRYLQDLGVVKISALAFCARSHRFSSHFPPASIQQSGSEPALLKKTAVRFLELTSSLTFRLIDICSSEPNRYSNAVLRYESAYECEIQYSKLNPTVRILASLHISISDLKY